MSTLLALQRSCKAGWKGSAPVIWRTVHIRKMEDWISVTSGIEAAHDQADRCFFEQVREELAAGRLSHEDLICRADGDLKYDNPELKLLWEKATARYFKDQWQFVKLLVVGILPSSEVHLSRHSVRVGPLRDGESSVIFPNLDGIRYLVCPTHEDNGAQIDHLAPYLAKTCVSISHSSNARLSDHVPFPERGPDGLRYHGVDVDHLPALGCSVGSGTSTIYLSEQEMASLPPDRPHPAVVQFATQSSLTLQDSKNPRNIVLAQCSSWAPFGHEG
jgi:hypothetical protein